MVLGTQTPPLHEVMDTLTQIRTQDTEPDPEGRLGRHRLTPRVAPDRRIAIEAHDMRHGHQSRAKTFNGFQEHVAIDVESNVTREMVVRPAHAPEPAAVALLVEAWENAPGLLQLASEETWPAYSWPNGRSRACP